MDRKTSDNRFVKGLLAVLLAVCLGIAGFLAGTAISLILIFVVNPQSFHWTMQLHMPWTWLLLMALAVLGAAALTAFAASRHAASGNVIRAVREDW